MKALSQRQIEIMFRNVAVLLFVALPAAVVSLVPNEWLFTGSAGLSSALDLLTPFIVALLPIAVSGALHQWFVSRFPAAWTSRKRRVAMIASSPLAGLGLAFMEFSFLSRFALPIVVGLIFYNTFAKVVPSE